MKAPDLFDRVAELLADQTCLSAAEARGTLRLTLKEVGLRPDLVSKQKLQVVVARVLPRQLEKRQVDDAAAVCSRISDALVSWDELPEPPTSPSDFLGRVRGSR